MLSNILAQVAFMVWVFITLPILALGFVVRGVCASFELGRDLWSDFIWYVDRSMPDDER